MAMHFLLQHRTAFYISQQIKYNIDAAYNLLCVIARFDESCGLKIYIFNCHIYHVFLICLGIEFHTILEMCCPS